MQPAIGCRPKISQCLQYSVVDLVRCVFDSCVDVFSFQEGIVLQNLIETRTGGEKLKYVCYPNALGANAGPASALSLLNSDSLQSFSAHISCLYFLKIVWKGVCEQGRANSPPDHSAALSNGAKAFLPRNHRSRFITQPQACVVERLY